MDEGTLRRAVGEAFHLRGAHVDPEAVLAAFGPQHVGVVPEGFTHSAYQLLEHMRLSLADQWDYCTRADYPERQWPADYWPKNSELGPGDWNRATSGYLALVEQFSTLALEGDLSAAVPTARKKTHTVLRGILLMLDHNAYHLGQLVSLGKALGTPFPKV